MDTAWRLNNNKATLVLLLVPTNIIFDLKISLRCEGDLAVTSVTPLVFRVDWVIWLAK